MSRIVHKYPELTVLRKHARRGATAAEMARLFDIPVNALAWHLRKSGVTIARGGRSREYLIRRGELRAAGYTYDEAERMAPVTKQIYGHGNPQGKSERPSVDLVANAVQLHPWLCRVWK